jgi:hypothetical protein
MCVEVKERVLGFWFSGSVDFGNRENHSTLVSVERVFPSCRSLIDVPIHVHMYISGYTS